MRRFLRWLVIAMWLLALPLAREPLRAAEESPYAELFEAVWSTVYDYYLGIPAVDWEAVRRVYEPRVLAAQSEDEAYALVQEMVALLGDPGTYVRTPAEIAAMSGAQGPQAGERFIGVGMLLGMTHDGDVVVLRVLERGPAERAGIRAGVRVAYVDGVKTAGMNQAEVAAMIRGEAGSTVAITVVDPDENQRTYSIRRAPVEFKSEVSSRNLGGGLGYLAIPTFRAGTEGEVLSHLRRLYRTDALLIDLRGFDGDVEPATLFKIAGLFTGDPLGILLTPEGPFGLFPDREWADGTGVFGVPRPTRLDYYEKPAVVIVDSSISGSPLALALVQGLRETGRAAVVGRGSPPGSLAGAGQVYLSLPGGGVLSVTSYFLFNDEGFVFELAPDVDVPLDRAYLKGLYEGKDPDLEAARERALALLRGENP